LTVIILGKKINPCVPGRANGQVVAKENLAFTILSQSLEHPIFNEINQNMTSKTTNIIYWVCTILFAALMIFSAVGGVQPSKEAIQFLHD